MSDDTRLGTGESDSEAANGSGGESTGGPILPFLSHSSKDDHYVAEFENLIRSFFDEETAIFNDIRSIPAGAEFWPEIEAGISQCRRFYLIVSPASMESEWVAKEIALARSLGKRVIGIWKENCDPHLLEGYDIVDFRPGASRQIRYNTKHLPATYTGELYGREAELTQLFTDLEDEQVRIVAFDAMGGTGKTALLYHFVQQLKKDGWHNLESVFIWSFYSQGSSEDKQTHAADFFEAAYAHFHPQGKAAPLPDDPREQGNVLADLIAAQPALLILDGLEPLQYAAGATTGARVYGGIKDPGVKTLLLRLADIGRGLTIVTTRIEIDEFTEGENTSFRRHHLSQLPEAAAIELLRDRGIEKATFPSDTHPELPESVREEFLRAIRDLDAHALSLNLAAHLVAESYDGQIRAFADVLPHLQDDQTIDEKHRSPFRVIRALEVGLYRVLLDRLRRMSAQDAVTDSPAANQLCLLYFLGLFDQPAELSLLEVVYDASGDVRDATHLLPEDKAEHLRQIDELIATRDAILNDPDKSDADHLEARHAFEEQFHHLSFHYWLPPVFAQFDPKQTGNRRVTNALQQLSEQNLVSKARLIEDEGGHAAWEDLPPEQWFDHSIDCHPLIREYFGHQLEAEYEPAFQAAHGRLYDHFRFAGLPEAFQNPVAYGALALKAAFPKAPVEDILGQLADGTLPKEVLLKMPPTFAQPDLSVESVRSAVSLLGEPVTETAHKAFLPKKEAGMTPLFAAIGHGCLAGRHNECFGEVYYPRIAQGDAKYATAQLGLYGQDLAALASFFLTRDPETKDPIPAFQQPHPHLQPSRQALVLNLAGFALRAIGRLPDAVTPMQGAVAAYDQIGDAKNAATNAGNLSELLLILGRIETTETEAAGGALAAAAEAVRFADQSGDLFQRMGQRTAEANALLAAGRPDAAETRFREAEALQRQDQPSLPRLYSLAGFLYGDLLLARNRAVEVAERAEYGLNDVKGLGVLSYALAELSQARAQSLLNPAPSTKNQALPPFLTSLHDANAEEFVVRGYLAQAEILLRASAPPGEIETALSEAETRARRGPMPLFEADALILRARLQLAGGSGQLAGAKDCRDRAAELIEKHGYGRREPDLAVLDAELDPSLDRLKPAIATAMDGKWWHLVERLEALARQIDGPPKKKGWFGGAKPGAAEALLEPLREAEAAYHAERDAYLAEVPRIEREGEELVLQGLSEEVIQNIANHFKVPADISQWPAEVRGQVVEAVREAQQ